MSTHHKTSISVYHSGDFVVTDGVAEGEPISFMDELVLDDIYQLSTTAERHVLTYEKGDNAFVIAPDSALGTAGNLVYLDCCITLIAPDSTTFEALIMVEVEGGEAVEVYLMPLATLRAEYDYRLVGANREQAAAKFGDVACVRFARGTHITMASGAQVPIEDLKVGDRVLTRDAGAQAIRWVGGTTLRAVGDFAPVVIKAGALSNSRDLVVSPDHRLFIYQRQDHLGAGRAEVLVRARHLINGETVYQQDGGFIDYYQLLFDDHHIIYAEGIAAETLLVDSRTRASLPSDVSLEFEGGLQNHANSPHQHFEMPETLANRPDIVGVLKRASAS